MKEKTKTSTPDHLSEAAELERNPHLFKQILDASGIAMAVRGANLRPVFANRAFNDFYGYSLDELRDLSLEELLLAETQALYVDTVIPATREGGSWEGEYTIRTKAGRLCAVWGRFDPIVDDGGRVAYIVSIMRDASEIRRLRNALNQTERHLHFLAEKTSDCLFRLRLSDGRYDYISSAITPITGYTPQEFYEVPRMFERLAPAEWGDTFAAWWDEFLAGLCQHEYESPLTHKDGSLHWVNQRITVIRDEDGIPAAIEGIITDITERKRAEEALRSSEQQYRLLTETIEDVIWTMDNDFTYTYVSPAITQLVGFTPAEYCRMELADTMTTASMKTIRQAVKRRVKAEIDGDKDYVHRMEIERLCKDGSTVWVESVTRRLRGDDGVPTGYLGITRDITSQKQWESRVRENETRFRTLFEDSPISLWEEDLGRLKAFFDELKARGVTNFRQYFADHPEDIGKCAQLVDVVDVNKATLEMLDARDKAELYGNLDKVLTESSMAAFTEELILIATGGYEYRGEITHRTLKGDIIWVMVHFSVPLEYRDCLSRVIVSLLDVTPRKRAEQALMDSEERYRVLVENAQEGVMVSQSGVVRYVNEAMFAILGYSMQEMQRLNPLELAHPDDKDMVLRQFNDLVSGNRESDFGAFRVLTRSGQTKWLTLNLKPIMWEGEDAYLEILTDVTVHKAMEEELRVAYAETEEQVRRRTQELSLANTQLMEEARERERAQGRIVSLTQQLIRIQEDERQRIARDLHDNVAQDLSSLVLQMETLFDGFPQAGEELLKRGEGVAEVLRGAIASVRDIAYGLRPPALDQLGLVKALENHCHDAGQRLRMDVDFYAAGIENIRLDFDTEINIYRMVQEALANIVKHAKAARATIRLVKSHPDILIRIEDNGQGFDVEERTSQAVGEKRMGLKSMEERARLIGGSMEIQSLTGTGTRIIFRIPIENPEREE